MLKEILEDIKKNKELANTDLSKVDANILSNMKGKKNRAKENLHGLFFEYKNELKKRVVFIMVNGKSSKKFADTAADNFAGVSQPAESFYEDIVDKVHAVNWKNKQMSNSIVDVLSSYLEDKALDIGVIGYPALVYTNKYSRVLKTRQDLLEVFTEMMNNEVGPEFVGMDILERATVQAVNNKFSGKVLPLLIHSTNTELIDALAKGFYDKLTPRVFKISAGVVSKEDSSDSITKVTGKITKKNVGQALKVVRDKL